MLNKPILIAYGESSVSVFRPRWYMDIPWAPPPPDAADRLRGGPVTPAKGFANRVARLQARAQARMERNG